MKVSVLV